MIGEYEDPRAIEFCLKCTSVTCESGNCPRYASFMRELRCGRSTCDMERIFYDSKTKVAMLTMHGETKTLMDWCERYGLSKNGVLDRVKRGMTFEEAFSKPGRRKRDAERKGQGAVEEALHRLPAIP